MRGFFRAVRVGDGAVRANFDVCAPISTCAEAETWCAWGSVEVCGFFRSVRGGFVRVRVKTLVGEIYCGRGGRRAYNAGSDEHGGRKTHGPEPRFL